MRLPLIQKNRHIYDLNRHKHMSTVELRLSLIEQPTKIEDEKLLIQVKNLIHAVWNCRQENPA